MHAGASRRRETKLNQTVGREEEFRVLFVVILAPRRPCWWGPHSCARYAREDPFEAPMAWPSVPHPWSWPTGLRHASRNMHGRQAHHVGRHLIERQIRVSPGRPLRHANDHMIVAIALVQVVSAKPDHVIS